MAKQSAARVADLALEVRAMIARVYVETSGEPTIAVP